MATVRDMRAAITANRAALREAIEGAADTWEASPGGEEWSPRQVVEHVLETELRFATRAAAILGGNPPRSEQFSFPSAEAAVDALRRCGAEYDTRYSWAEDRDLPKELDGRTLERTMAVAASHLLEHADQVKALS